MFKPLFPFLFILTLSEMGYSNPPAQSCNSTLQKLSRNFKDFNPSAKKAFDGSYPHPHERPLWEYNDILFGQKSRKSLLKHIPTHGTAIDLGGGKGVAYREIARKKKVNAIVINTQKQVPPEKDSKDTFEGKFEYKEGYAEEVLTAFGEKVDLITDIWGAFSYTTEKAYLIETIFKKLKPGGKAFILLNPLKTPAEVISEGESLDLSTWLGKKYPNLFKVYDSPGQDTPFAHIIEITKPKTGSDEISLPLIMKERSTRTTPSGFQYPEVVYTEKTNSQ